MTVTAVGIAIAGMLIAEEGIFGLLIAKAGQGTGLILAQVWTDSVVETPSKAAQLDIAASDSVGEGCDFFRIYVCTDDPADHGCCSDLDYLALSQLEEFK